MSLAREDRTRFMASNGNSRRLYRSVSSLLFLFAASSFGCRRADDGARAEPASASADAKKTVAPSALPVCGTDDPLSALCNLGTESARFECLSPEPVQFCSKGTEWVCSYPREDPPAITFRARFDQQGPRLKGGEMVDVSKFKREGKVRGVAVQLAVSDEKNAQARVDEIARKLVAWGCVALEPQRTRVGTLLDPHRTDLYCYTWAARVRYSAAVHRVILEAAENGFLECQ
jgi:hypothetical protein